MRDEIVAGNTGNDQRVVFFLAAVTVLLTVESVWAHDPDQDTVEVPEVTVTGEILNGATGKENELRSFARTGANCLDMSDIEDAQDIALLLMLLREGRREEAVGGAVRIAAGNGSDSEPEAYAKAVTELLERWGLDWEQIFAGGQVEDELKGWRHEHPHSA